MRLAAKAALVTGGAAGIGRAIAAALDAAGARVLVADREAAEGVGTIRVDLTRDADVVTMVDEAVHRLGGLDVLVNNAGGYEAPTFPDAPPAHWRATLELNLGAVMLATQLALPAIAAGGGGAIVNVASSAGLGTSPYAGVEYAVAKAGVLRLTTALGDLHERTSVRVNCVCPHTVATDSVLHALERTPLDELAPPPATLLRPEEVAGAVMGLLEDDSLSGRILVLWGGEPPRLVPSGLREGGP